jgi:hypothetical protein
MNIMDFIPGSAADFLHAGRSCPTQPSLDQSKFYERKKADPSATTRRDNCYPIPGFFDYRVRTTGYEVL